MTIRNINHSLKIDTEWKERTEFSSATIFEKDGEQLGIRFNQRDAEDKVVIDALGFVLECAGRYNITGTWFAVWSNGCSKSRLDTYGAGSVTTDLAEQAVMFVSRNKEVNFVKKGLEEIMAIIADLPSDAPMAQDMHRQIEWLQENAVGGWGCFSSGAGEDGGVPQPKIHFLFKKDTDAVAFKLRFG